MHPGKVDRARLTRLTDLPNIGPAKRTSASRLSASVRLRSGKRSITAGTDLRPCRSFGLSDGWWLRGQAAYDTAIAKESLHKELAAIQRCSLLAT